MIRKAKISRKTKETSISAEINIDGKGKYKIDTGIGFLNHMLEQLSKHSSMDIILKAKGDTHIDLHHTTEDSGKMDDTGQKSGFRRICIFDHLWNEGKLIKSLRVFSYVKLNIKILGKT